MKKYIFPLVGLAMFAGSVSASDLTGVKIYVNPGHGGYNMTVEKNDRNVPTIPFEPLDQDGFWESSCNLVKGLELERLLKASGASVLMSRTQNRDEDDKDLSEIAEEANAYGSDVFISIHSNALGTNNGTNYLLCLYKGIEGGAANEPAKPIDKELAMEAWPYLYDNNLTVWTGNYTPENPLIRDDYHFLGYYLGVMRPLTVPGFLVEGSFHDYEPETHRLLNDDYAELTAIALHRFFCDHFDAEKLGTGVIAGSVKDSQRVMTHQRFNNYVKKSHDQYQPINGATVTLKDMSGAVLKTYTTDDFYNGVYVFRDLTPGNYKVLMEAEGYISQEKEVEVKADQTTSFYTLLEDPNYIPPEKIPGKANVYASGLKAEKVAEGKYKLVYTLNADAENVEIKVFKGENVLKAVSLGAQSKGVNEQELDLTSIAEQDLAWSVTASAAPTTADAPLKFTDDDVDQMQFKEARGLAVDNNMESPYFGRVYVTESAGGAISGYRTTTDGIFILDAALSDVTEQGNDGYKGNIDWSNTSSPMRVTVASDGTLFITDWSDAHSGIWMMNPANPEAEFEPVFAEGSRDGAGLMTIDEVNVHGSIASCWVEGEGDDRQLYTFDEDYMNDVVVNKFALLRYDIGKLENPWDKAPSAIVFDNAASLQQNGNSVIWPDERGGWWISQYRYTDNATIPSLIHVNAEGAVDFNSGNTGLIGTSQRGAMALNCDGTLLAMGCGDEVKIFTVEYGETAPALTFKYSIAPALGDYASGLAFDCADNVYLASGTSRGIGAWALPKENNVFETIAPAAMMLNSSGSSVTDMTADALNVRMKDELLVVSGTGALQNVVIYNLSGMPVFEADGVMQAELTVDMSSFAKGVYLVKVKNQTVKVVK